MFSLLRNKFGIPGVISVIALVFAMMGGAYAATGGNPLASTSSHHKNHKKSKAKKGPRGPRGKTGPAGPAGPAGLPGGAGAAGPKGEKGDKGDKGDTGGVGNPGKSVAVTEIPTEEPECAEFGGAHVEEEGVPPGVDVCNGETGFTATLPSKKTETGTWEIVGPLLGGPEIVMAPISFSIPLASGLDGSHVHFMKKSDAAASGCTGGTAAAPKANQGNLCVYTTEEQLGNSLEILKGLSPSHEAGAGTAGALLYKEEEEPDTRPQGIMFGTWAVTAP